MSKTALLMYIIIYCLCFACDFKLYFYGGFGPFKNAIVTGFCMSLYDIDTVIVYLNTYLNTSFIMYCIYNNMFTLI